MFMEQNKMTTLNKMQLAKDIYEIVNAADYTPIKSIRADFIERLVIEAEMTKSGASTYYQNLRNKANGRGLYEYNKTASKKSTAEKKVKIEVDPRLDINVESIEVKAQVDIEPAVDTEMKPSVLDEVMESVEAQTQSSTDDEPTQSVLDQVMDSVEDVAAESEIEHKAKAKAQPKRVDVKAKADVVEVQGSAPKTQQMRWGVEQDGKIVDMFKTRTAARKFIEEHGGTVVDHGA